MRLLITTFVVGLFMITTQVKSGSWDYESPGSSLKWNPYASTWNYEDPGSTLKWNPYDNSSSGYNNYFDWNSDNYFGDYNSQWWN